MELHLQKTVVSVVSKLSTPVFLADHEAGKSSLTLHVRAGLPVEGLQLEAERAITRAGLLLRVDVRRHRLSKLTHPRSLEHWLRRFGTGQIVYDPTHIASRARGLLLAANSCRSSLGSLVAGSFFDPTRRSLVVYARLTKKDAAQALALRLRIAGIAQDAWQRAVAGLDSALTAASRLNVRVVSDAAVGSLVPVDSKSASLVAKVAQRVRRWIAAGVMALAMVGVGSPAHAKLPPTTAMPIESISGMGDWGILTGLSVFVEGGRHYETDAFAVTGLRVYFGEGYECRDGHGKKLAPCPPIYVGS